jgi:RNA polymerase sigma-70 factor (ECF subfamily)
VQPSPEDRVLSSERAGHIAAAIEKLPDRQRAVFTMCHVADQSTSEVSQALGLSEATVRVHLFRAVRKLRKLLASERVSNMPAPRYDAAGVHADDHTPTRSVV